MLGLQALVSTSILAMQELSLHCPPWIGVRTVRKSYIVLPFQNLTMIKTLALYVEVWEQISIRVRPDMRYSV
jgi:hypothetical protein